MIRKLLIALLLLGVVAGITLKQEATKRWEAELMIPPEGYQLDVASGQRFRDVVTGLQQDGIVQYPWVILAQARWLGLDSQIKRGEYLLPPGITALDLLKQLVSGEVVRYQVTLPEGITLAAALELLAEHPQLRVELQGAADQRILALVAPASSGEGLFFPDSYHFEKGSTDWQILRRAHDRMRDILAEEWGSRSENLPYADSYEALIMASIVERETGVVSERGQIAGVFVSRLGKRMRLQTDPTVIYGLGEVYDGNLRRADLKDDSNPYNTYRHSGLPPTPIALPGRAAIHAALHPSETSALYFVARGDGSHQFSNTLEEHNKAVRQYQLQRKKNYRSSPGNQ